MPTSQLPKKQFPPTQPVILIALAMVILAASPAFAQQTYVTRYDAFVGYGFLDSPAVGLFENGVAAQAGVRPRTWFSLGIDFTYASGNLVLTPNLLTPAIQQSLTGLLGSLAAAGQLPAGYTLAVKSTSKTETFAAGPQLAYRHWKPITLFLRPVFLGAIHETATPKPTDPIATLVVSQLAPSGHKTDTTWFIGLGGGIDFILTHHLALRAQTDVVWDHLFSDLLQNGRWTVRFSVGPAFNFGRNIVK